MNIHNFDHYVNKTILDRGYSYFIEGNVVEGYEQGKNEYIFHIEGSEDYEVVVEIADDGDILYSQCDCPYDFGSVCKHEVAAYFQLIDMLKHGSIHDKLTSKTRKRTTIQEVLSNLSKEELINIIISMTNHDATLENSLIVKYSNGDNRQELESCQELIAAIVQKYTDREGFIKYRDTRAFVTELEEIIEKARNTEDALIALDIALLLLEEAIDAFQYADDSSGHIGFLVTETLVLIEETVTSRNVKAQQKPEIFTKLLAQTDNEIFDGWIDFKIDLLKICFEFADDETLREQLRRKIESNLDNKSNERYKNYENEYMLELLFRLIELYGTQEEAEQFIQDHIQFSSFREKLLNKYLQEKNYHKVIEVAKDGETQDHQYPGLISKWKKLRYVAYKKLSLKKEQSKLAKELLFEGNIDYYYDLKVLASDNQGEFYTNLKHELKTRRGWNASRILLKIIEEENDLEEILNFVRTNPEYIEEYAEKLANHFKDEITEIFQGYIHTVARNSSNRRDYQRVCDKILRYKKIVGKPKQVEMIDELMDLYRKRPAFIDELGKVK